MSLESKFSKIGKKLDNSINFVSNSLQKKRSKNISASVTTYSILIFDSFIAFLSFFISIHIKIGMDFIDYAPIYILKNMFIFGLVSSSVFLWTQTYQSYWRYTTVEDVIPVICSVILANILFFPMMMLMNQDDSLPYSVIIVNFFVLSLMLIVPRFMVKIIYNNRINKMHKMQRSAHCSVDRVVLVGSPNSIDVFLRDVLSNNEIQFNFDPVAVLSIDPADIGHTIQGVPILGDILQIKHAFRALARDNIVPKQIIITEKSLNDEMKKVLISYSQTNNILLVHVIHRCTFNTIIE